mmetsp:Transcript_79744/g.145780  ORF Transcript_79744/g.145780 Transcript_79744/m.145780 type:complete len:309 (-) Transcript_79744:135-1061(-)
MSAIIKEKAWAAICTFITVFTFHSLNFIAIELEMPFGDDENDLPLDHFQAEMNRSILLLLHEMSDHLPHTSSKCRREYESLIGCSRDTVRRTQNLHRSNTEGELNNHHDALFEGDEGLDDLMSTTSSMPPELDDERKEEGLSSVKVLAEKTIHTVEHAAESAAHDVEHAAESAAHSVASMARGLLHGAEGLEHKMEGLVHEKREAEDAEGSHAKELPEEVPTEQETSHTPGLSEEVAIERQTSGKSALSVQAHSGTCPEGHQLAKEQTDSDGWSCSECHTEFPQGATLYGCRDCDYDVCRECIGTKAY